MWVNLEDREIAAIVEKFVDGSIVDKVLQRPDRETGLFVNAAESFPKEGLEIIIDDDATIDRYPGGAWVMSWLWIDEKTADVPPALDFYTLSETTQKRIRAISDLRMEPIARSENQLAVTGELADCEWYFSCHERSWSIWARDTRRVETIRSDWMHHEEWTSAGPAFKMDDDQALSCVVKGLELLRLRSDDPTEKVLGVIWRQKLELHILGEVSAAEAMQELRIGAKDLARWAHKLVDGQTQVSIGKGLSGGLTFTGPALERFDLQ